MTYWIHLWVCNVCKTPTMVVRTTEHYVAESPADFHDGDTCRLCCNGSVYHIGKVKVDE